MTVDDLATQGARASAAVIVPYFSKIFLAQHHHNYKYNSRLDVSVKDFTTILHINNNRRVGASSPPGDKTFLAKTYSTHIRRW